MTRSGRAVLGLMALALVIALGAGGVWLLAVSDQADPLAQAHEAYDHGDWAQAEATARAILEDRKDDPSALRLLARAAGRQGEDNTARRIYQRLGTESMEPEDHVVLALGLLREGRTDDARETFQFAIQDDRDHPEALHELARIEFEQGRPNSAVRLAEGLDKAKSPNPKVRWAARAGVLLGVLRDFLKTPEAAVEPLKAALEADPQLAGTLLKPAEARKLLARVFLKINRPSEARAQLEIVNRDDPDLETSWLLSRAAIQLGDKASAAKALADSGGYGKDRPEAFEPAAYVGAARCAECHQEIHDSQQSSRHAQTFHRPEELAEMALPEKPLADPHSAGVSHAIRRQGEKLEVLTTNGDKTYQAIVKYVMGSGNHARTLVGTDTNDQSVRELRLSYYHKGDLWDLTTGHQPVLADPHNALGMKQTEDSLQACLGCHTTNPHAIAHDPKRPEALDRAIGCERCHGPGGNHVAAMEHGIAEMAIGRPRVATASAVNTLCGQCHGIGSRKIPMDDEKTLLRFQATTLPRSRCATATDQAISCATCHDPHANAEQSPAFYEAKCLACHGPSAAHEGGTSKPRRASEPVLPETSRRVACPVNPKQGCIDCHMPGRDGSMPHSPFTDHRIRVHRDRP